MLGGAGYPYTYFDSQILAVAPSESSTTAMKTATRFDSEDTLPLLGVG